MGNKGSRLWIISAFAGLIFGFVVAFLLFAAKDYGLFAVPVKITFSGLYQEMQSHKFDSEFTWSIQPQGSSEYLVTLDEILHRQQFVLSRSDFESVTPIQNRTRLLLKGGKILTWPGMNEVRGSKPSKTPP